MVTLFSLVFVVSCIGIWYFIKRKPDRNMRNIVIGVAVISFAVVGMIGESGRDDARDKTVSTNSSSTIAEQEKEVEINEKVGEEKKLFIKLSSEYTADEKGNIFIEGETLPNAEVKIGMGFFGDSTKADKSGKFKLEDSNSETSDRTITVNASLNDQEESKEVIIKANETIIAKEIEKQKKQEEEEQKAEEERKQQEEEENRVINVSNSPEFKQLLSTRNDDSKALMDFAEKNDGKKIEFDGCVVFKQLHGDKQYSYDLLLQGGDYVNPDTSNPGPVFKIEQVTYHNLQPAEGAVQEGENIHIIAEIFSSNADTGIFKINPVKVTIR